MFVANCNKQSISAEAYRELRTNIKYSSPDKELKIIVITSSIQGEGKSTVAGNLAFSLSQNGKRVLLIDCDLRKPSLHDKFDVINDVGLTDLLINKNELKDALKPIATRLFLITSGTKPPNPAEIVGSKNIEDFLEEMSINFDHIIIDTPPVLPVTDARVLASKADATVFVVRSKKCRSKLIKQAYEKLKIVNANIIGSIINDCESSYKESYYNYFEKDYLKNKIKKFK